MVAGGRVRPHTPFLPISQKIVDILALGIGILTCSWLINIQVNDFLLLSYLLLLVNYYIASAIISNNHSWRMRTIAKEAFRCAKIWSISYLITIFTINLLDDEGNLTSQFIIVNYIACVSALLSSRVATRFLLNYLRIAGKNTKKIAIVGNGDLAKNLHQTFLDHPWMGVDFKGFYCDPTEEEDSCCYINSENERTGSITDLVSACKRGGIDEVYLTLPMREEARMKQALTLLSDTSVHVYVIPDIFTFSLLHSRWRDINGIPVVGIFDTPLQGTGGLIKRIEDVMLASLILCLIAIPMMLIAIGVKFTSQGPIIFKQRRYGYGGKEVEVWKFRSMSVCENGDQVTQATKNDVRVTPFGAFLRRTSLDELPQFFNVLQGHMSIVGPRPHAVAHNEQYRKDINGYMLRHLVKPGITGWAQINGWRGETDTLEKMQKRVDFDLDYIRNWSLNLDLKIIITTVFKGFVGKQAY